MNYLNDLNEKQIEAVKAPMGAVLVLAGAGSGKTKALTYRLAYLIEKEIFKPEEILAVTFTNKAAEEMKERVSSLLQQSSNKKVVKGPTMGTFHSLGARILRKDIGKLKPFNPSFTIFDENDSKKILKDILNSRGLEKEISPSLAKSIISSVKNKNLELNSLDDPRFIEVYDAYEKALEKINAVDFDNLLFLTVQLFKKEKNVLAKYQKQWRYLLVDEYQDTNDIQYQLIKLLLGTNDNIFAVGDDAQSIYGFRGANFQNILNFEKDFPEAQVYKLEENYRSTKIILDTANKVILLSPQQKEKVLWTQNESGEKIKLYKAIDEKSEAMFVTEEIVGMVDDKDPEEPQYIEEESGTEFFDKLMSMSNYSPTPVTINRLEATDEVYERLGQIAVLYRTNAQSRVFEEFFMKSGIPYHLVGSLRFYERKEVKDILSFLRFVVNPNDNFSLTRIIKIPPRGIGEKSLELILNNELQGLTRSAASSFQNFKEKIKQIRNLSEDETLKNVIKKIVSHFGLEEYYLDGTKEGEERWENVRELIGVAASFEGSSWKESAREFLEEVALYSATDEVGKQKGVVLMTLHQAKGLEFDTVFMVGMEEGLLPHARSLEKQSDLAEEVRLAYVGITRARKKLYLTNAYSRNIYGSSSSNPPSRILEAIPEEFLEVKDSWTQ